MKRIVARKDLTLLFAVALGVRLLYLFVMVGEVDSGQLLRLAPDTVAYLNMAQGIIGDRPADEDSLNVFGPGYAFLLGVFILVFGMSPYPVLIVQVIVGSLGCLLLYKFGKELTGSKTVGMIAGYLSALSFTSVSLATFILSDSLFFVLFLLGNVLFLLGMRHDRYRWHIAAGVSIGAAILVRAIGQFWPVAMLGFVFVLPPRFRGRSWWGDRLAVLKKAYVAPLIALVIMGGWMARNYVRYSVPFYTFAAAGGPANVAMAAASRMENKDGGRIQAEWMDEYDRTHGVQTPTRADMYRAFTTATRKTFFRYPGAMLDEYRKLIWENVGAMNELYYHQIPMHKYDIAAVMGWFRGLGFDYASFWLSLASFLALLYRRRWRPLSYLGAVFVYFTLMVGFTHWQGSRLFYPAEMAWTVLVGILVVEFRGMGAALLRRLRETGRPRVSIPAGLSGVARRAAGSIAGVSIRRGLPAIVLAALVLRVGYLLIMLRQLTPDQVMTLTSDVTNYVGTAKGLLGLQWYDPQWILLFGPGYMVFLAGCFFCFGVGPFGPIIIQILLSCFTCLLLYAFARELTGSSAVGFVAAVISATSFTAIAQSVALLSDTLFFFLFLAANLLFLKGLKNGRWWPFLLSGLILGAAVLTRAVGQFWPAALIVILIVLPKRYLGRTPFPSRRAMILRGAVAPLIALVIMGGWIVRNAVVHGMPVVAASGANGLGRLTAYTQMKLNHCTINDVYAAWADEYEREHACDSVPVREWYALFERKARQTAVEHPWLTAYHYLGRIKVNITASNELYFHQLPRSENMISRQLDRMHRALLHFVVPLLTLWGFWLMIRRRLWMPVLFLGTMYLLFFFLVGFGMWQGSRLFFPAQIAWSVVVSYLLVDLWSRWRARAG